MWTYRATCIRWLDGDTLALRCDLGFNVSCEQTVRLAGLDTPELRSPDPAERGRAVLAHRRAMALLPPGAPCTIATAKGDPADKYGRFLGRVTLADGTDLNAALLAEGLARPYDGGAR